MASLSIIFEKLFIHDDADNLGPGDFTFSFKVNGKEVVALKREQEKSSGNFFDLTKWPKNSMDIDLSGGQKLIISGDITERDSELNAGDDHASAKAEFDPRSFPKSSITAQSLHFHGDSIHAELFYSVTTNIGFAKDFVLYEHANFEGNFQIVQVPLVLHRTFIDVDRLLVGNDTISSVELPITFSIGEFRSKMVLFEDQKAEGAFIELNNSHANLTELFFWRIEGKFARKIRWNDTTSSLWALWVSNLALMIYEHRCYGGKLVKLHPRIDVSVSTYRSNELEGLDNAVSSLTIPQNHILVLFSDNDAQGDSIVLTKDEPELRETISANAKGETIGWHDRTSSMRLIPVNDRVLLFDKTNYGGIYFERDLPPVGESTFVNLKDFNIGDNNLKSLVTGGADVTIYELKDKKGKSFHLGPNTTVADLAELDKAFGWHKKVSCVEIRTPS